MAFLGVPPGRVAPGNVSPLRDRCSRRGGSRSGTPGMRGPQPLSAPLPSDESGSDGPFRTPRQSPTHGKRSPSIPRGPEGPRASRMSPPQPRSKGAPMRMFTESSRCRQQPYLNQLSSRSLRTLAAERAMFKHRVFAEERSASFESNVLLRLDEIQALALRVG